MIIHWRKSAENDFKEIREYYTLNVGQDVAKSLAEKIIKSTEILLDFPYVGRKFDDDVFELIVSKTHYILPYMVIGNDIYILRVFDTRREPIDWIGERELLYREISLD